MKKTEGVALTMADQVTPQQIEEWVAEGDYHTALQALGRSDFQPGDGSWSEWIMMQMHHVHYARSRLTGLKAEPEEYQQIDRFLRKVALIKLSKEDHARCWQCYIQLCELHGEPILPVVYHTLFFDASPMELAVALAQRGDDEGLEIMLYNFGHLLPKWELVDQLPVSLPAYQYARFILDDQTMEDDWLDLHVQKRYERAGQVVDWIELLEQHRTESPLLARWRTFLDVEDSQFTEQEQTAAPNDDMCSLEVPAETIEPVSADTIEPENQTMMTGDTLSYDEAEDAANDALVQVTDVQLTKETHNQENAATERVATFSPDTIEPETRTMMAGDTLSLDEAEDAANNALVQVTDAKLTKEANNQENAATERVATVSPDSREPEARTVIVGDTLSDNEAEDTANDALVPATDVQLTKEANNQKNAATERVAAVIPTVTPERGHSVGTEALEVGSDLKYNTAGVPTLIEESPPVKANGGAHQALQNGGSVESSAEVLEAYVSVDREKTRVEIFVALEAEGDNASVNQEEEKKSQEPPYRNQEVSIGAEKAEDTITRLHDGEEGLFVETESNGRVIADSPVRTRSKEKQISSKEMASELDKMVEDGVNIDLPKSNKPVGDQPTRSLRRDLSDCASVLQTFLQELQSQEEIDQEHIKSGLKDLRKRLKMMRKVHCKPTREKMGEQCSEQTKALDQRSIDQEEAGVDFLRSRVEELENLLHQYQSREAGFSPQNDQGCQDTKETTDGEPFRSQELEIQSLKDQLSKIESECDIEKRADKARIRYLQQLLREREQLIASPWESSGGTPLTPPMKSSIRTSPRKPQESPKIPDSPSSEKQMQDLAYALEISERQRAQALEDLQLEREFYAAKVKQLQLAFRKMVGNI